LSLFVAYLPLGYPDKETSFELIKKLDKAGTDIIEIGIPFSDPIADGETIQQASSHSLGQGTIPEDAFSVPSTRAELYIMTYANILHHMGYSTFRRRAIGAGYQGIIIPDLPLEHTVSMEGLNQVQLVAPNTSESRIHLLAERTEGFLYVVSHLATTGGVSSADGRLKKIVETANESSNVPKLVGFGIDSPERACQMLSLGADGVIVGSALIKHLGKYGIDSTIEFAESIIHSIHSGE